MKAIAAYPSTKEVRVIEQHAPYLTEPDHVRVRMLEIGICGTDKEICAFEYGTPPEGSDYLVIGHEALGEVIEVGPAVNKVKVGDLVVPTVRVDYMLHMDRGDICTVSTLSMGSHTGTHMDGPLHFVAEVWDYMRCL